MARGRLEEWDALAPLSDGEQRVIEALKRATEQTYQPRRKLSAASSNEGSPSTSHPDGFSPFSSPRIQSRPGTAHPPPGVGSLVDIQQPIGTPQEFHEFFARVERSLEREQEEIYRKHLAELERHINDCAATLEQLEDARALIQEMEANYKYVEENSQALQLACETMLDEQKHLIEVKEGISARLDFFRELDAATRTLNLPGEAIVLREDFQAMLDRLDACLEYLGLHRDFKDAEIYIIRFQQCLTRSMTLIKMYFVSAVRKLVADASDKSSGKDLSETAQNALHYTKFSASAASLRGLVYELEKRASLMPGEYESLLHECYAIWVAGRTALLGATLAEEVRRMDPQGSDLVQLARTGCHYLRSVALKEWSLWKELFRSGERDLYQYLETLCDNLYDSLRPRILHEPKLDVLCELCTILTAIMALDSEVAVVDEEDETEAGSVVSYASGDDARPLASPPAARTPSVGQLRFTYLLQTIIQDVQTRLVFRGQAVIRNEVQAYAPVAADLDYPAKIETEEVQRLALWTEEEADQDREAVFQVPSEEIQTTWYPTLRRTVWVLSRLHSFVNDAVFEDFAGEAVTICRQSLTSASALITAKQPDSKLDGHLFLIRHLLFLKEMVRSVDLMQIDRAADFSSVTDALINLLRHTSVLFNPNALYQLASKGMPSFAQTMTDAKTELDASLRKACEDFISDASYSVTSHLSAFLDRSSSFMATPGHDELGNQEWASKEAIEALHNELLVRLGAGLDDIVGKLRLYLNDEKTIRVLLPPFFDELIDVYTTFYNLIRSELDFTTSSVLTTPTALKAKVVSQRGLST